MVRRSDLQRDGSGKE